MVTDTFDSVKFRLNENHHICSEEEYDRAGAAVVEFLLFREKPLELTFPQLFDGYFASLGEDAAERQNTLFTLLQQGRIKITSYYYDTPPAGNPLFFYLRRFPFSNAGFKYSSMPFLTQHIGEEESGTGELFGKVKDYILRLFAENTVSGRPVIYDDGTALAAELRNFMEFFERLTACEGVRNQSVFLSHRAARLDFSEFMRDALSDIDQAAALFSLTGNRQPIADLCRCKSRSECNALLECLPDDGLSHIRRNALDTLYNKFTFSVFPDHEINVRQLNSEEQSLLLRDILQKCDETAEGSALRYRKNETKQMHRADRSSSCLSVKDALELRGEIESLHEEYPAESWYDTVRRYRDRLNLRLFGAEEDGKRTFCVRGKNGINEFTAAEGFAAAAKLSRFENTMTRYENTFTFEG